MRSPKPPKPDPYCSFKDDAWRFRALRDRVVCAALVAIATVIVIGFGPNGAAVASSVAAIARGLFSRM